MSASGRVALIIGHRGQDGTLLREFLEKEGTEVVGVGRSGLETRPVTEATDLTSVESTSRLISSTRPTEIYYLAAHHGSSETMSATPAAARVTESWTTHVAGFDALLQAIQRLNSPARVALASSCLIYGPSEGLIDESAQLRPDSVYGVTKAAAMLLARDRRKVGVPVFSAVLFPHESGLRSEAFIASKIVRAGLRIQMGSSERVAVAAPDAVVDWSSAESVVANLVTLLRNGDPDDYIFASGRANTVGDLIDAVSRELNISLRENIDVQPDALQRPSVRRIGNPARLMRATSWQPEPDINAFVRRLIASHRHRLAVR